MNLNDLTWICDICGKERPDRNIAVITYPIKDWENAERNLKYCNDNQDCINKAILKHVTREV